VIGMEERVLHPLLELEDLEREDWAGEEHEGELHHSVRFG
jgi:hypothetical protein